MVLPQNPDVLSDPGAEDVKRRFMQQGLAAGTPLDEEMADRYLERTTLRVVNADYAEEPRIDLSVYDDPQDAQEGAQPAYRPQANPTPDAAPEAAPVIGDVTIRVKRPTSFFRFYIEKEDGEEQEVKVAIRSVKVKALAQIRWFSSRMSFLNEKINGVRDNHGILVKAPEQDARRATSLIDEYNRLQEQQIQNVFPDMPDGLVGELDPESLQEIRRTMERLMIQAGIVQDPKALQAAVAQRSA